MRSAVQGLCGAMRMFLVLPLRSMTEKNELPQQRRFTNIFADENVTSGENSARTLPDAGGEKDNPPATRQIVAELCAAVTASPVVPSAPYTD